ncbi:DNA repair/transcription protein MET18/MMS19 [Marchantia polymorpha subsp. ruderalis]|uniref:MMS19 nucleotide excision repair protein n=2 Tax=Marchantia polymorpha TaxID=3197 RepID=A0AAF6AN24_MARPO|nr:hypothetical protein MARPO_0036s0119 [Marchantia polymorpha]PTQ41145.1 hypothetical protein MARPO_0036s0119 [Marchantia polymorpha]BBM97843.1 hypothetical protein Mp_1g08780 [Marchantia polymorpha subsp. ruderalis]BBM97844.1 hypothetical protein Mp_1g08780 [Marchantia polymorpha subsp. ruderalis]|eukprot:PTQ41144.1 hypothetical protein MARPO_0036s0119 [Marchantia polymorpha]
MACSSNWVAHVDVYVDPDCSTSKQVDSRNAISKLLLDKTITIQQLVLVAGKYLTSNDNAIRARGLLLLAELLEDLANTPMEDTAIHSLASFFSNRLQDWHSLRPALIGSIALARRPKRVGAVQPEDAETLGRSIIEQLDVQALSQKDRMLSLELYESLLTLHVSSMEPLGPELVLGIIAAIEEEKDPRCILVAFRLVEKLASIFPEPDGPFGENAEDIFDIVSRYFPISFNTPQDPRGITREDLSSALLKVFTATPLFAPFCFPVLLEKLSSTLKRAKLDALNYIGHCALSYDPEALSEHAGDIWTGLKSEIFRQEDGVSDQKDSLILEEAFSCFARCIEASQKVRTNEDDITGDFMKLVLEDDCVVGFLRRVKNELDQEIDPGDGIKTYALTTDAQLQAVGRLLGAAARASCTSCYIVTKTFLSSLLPSVEVVSPKSSDHQSSESVAAKGHSISLEAGLSLTGLEAVIFVLEGARHLANVLADSSNPSSSEFALKYWLDPVILAAPVLIDTFSRVVASGVVTTVLKLGVAGLQALASYPATLSPLSEDQLETVLTFLTSTFLDQTKGSELKDQALGAILAASNLEEKCTDLHRQEFLSSREKEKVSVLNVVLPKLLDAVQEACSPEPLDFHLRALAALSASRESVREKVLKVLGQLVPSKLGQTLALADGSFEFAKAVMIFRCLSGQIIPFCEIGSVGQLAACDVVMDIWRSIGSLPQSTVYIAPDILLPLMEVIRVTVQRCPERLQKEILTMSLSVLQGGYSPEQNTKLSGVRSLSAKHMEGKEWLVALVGSVIVGLLPSVLFEERESVLRLLVSTSVANLDPVITDTAAQAAASMLNKWNEKKSESEEAGSFPLKEAITIAVDEGWMPIIKQVRRDGTGDMPNSFCAEDAEKSAARSIYALALAGKGLAMRGHSRIADIAGAMLRVLESLGKPVAYSGTTDSFEMKDQSDKLTESAVGRAAVESFGLIVNEHASFLSKSQNAVIRPLYKQRFFTSILSPLIEAVRLDSNQSSRIWFYRSFACLLSGTPLGAVLTEGKRVFPLILEGLSTLCTYPEDSEYVLQLLLSLSSFLVDESNGRSFAAEYVQSMVNRLVPVSQYKSSMMIRESALQCLAAIVGLSFTRVFPVKSQVMKAITIALDDKKRLVRKEAVRCREVWSAITST